MNPTPDPKHKRHPIKNFILLPELQWPYIIRILALVNLSGVLMATAVCVLFYLRRQSHEAASLDLGADMVNQSLAGMLAEKSLLEVMVPAFIIADVVSLAIGLVLSLYFSRKISVPLYRVQKWAEVIVSGDLSFRLKFRPGDDLQGLEESCNRVSAKYCEIIEDLRRQVEEHDGSAASKLEGLQASLSRIKT